MKIKTTVCFASVACLEDEALFQKGYLLIPKDRQEKVDRYRLAKDKKLSLGAALLLRFALEQANIPVPHERLLLCKNGKPYLPGKEAYFNLSHAGEYAMCAISSGEIGCDIERISPMDPGLAKRFFSPSEYESILAQKTPEEQTDLFFRYWTLKESFVKAVGIGMKLPFSDFQIDLAKNITVRQNIDQRAYHFSEFETVPGYKSALCMIDSEESTSIRSIDLSELLKT